MPSETMTQTNNWEMPSNFEPPQTLLLNDKMLMPEEASSNILIQPEMRQLQTNETNVFDHSLHSKVVVRHPQKRAKSATQSK